MKLKTILIVVLAAAAAAQTPRDMAPGIGQKMKQNAETLRQYTYKRRTVIQIKGKSRGARVELVRYIDGKMETVPLEAPPRPTESARPGGLRRMMAQKQKEEMKDDIERLTALMHRYVSPESGSMRTMLAKAAISNSGPGPEAGVKLVATGLVEPSDSFTLTWSLAGHRPEKIEIRTELDGKPVSATMEYASLPNGLFYNARTVVSQPKKDLNIMIDTFDYVHGGDAK